MENGRRFLPAVLALLLASSFTGPAPAASPAEGREAPPLPDRVRRIVDLLEEGPAEVRARAAKELTGLGLPAIEFLPARLPRSANAEAWAALEEALAAMGPVQAAADLRAVLGGAAGTIGETLRGLVDRLEARGGDRFAVPLLRTRNADATLVPPSVAIPLEGEGEFSVSLLLRGARWSAEKGKLRLDTGGRGKYDRTLTPGKPAVVDLGEGASARPVLLYTLLDRWAAAPADALAGKLGQEPVLLLDVDGDGRPGPGVDWIRVGEGSALRPFRAGELHWTPRGCFRIGPGPDGGGPSLLCAPEPLPSRVDAGTAAGLAWLNGWRRGVGLPPFRLDRRRSEGCRLHAEYMAFHGVRHDEDEGHESYTPLGAAAGRNSSIGGYRELTELLGRIHGTVLHRDTCIGSAAEGIGLGAGRGGTVAWASAPAPDRETGLLLVPGPGQTGVAPWCGSERPRPDIDPDFYGKPRGYPVSVTPLDVRILADCSIELFEGGAGRPLPGTLFTPSRPYTTGSGLEGNHGTAQFVADGTLRPRTLYTARFTGRGAAGEVVAAWSFTTGEAR